MAADLEEITEDNIGEKIAQYIPGVHMKTKRKDAITVKEALEKTVESLIEAFSQDPLAIVGKVCDTGMQKNIRQGLSSQKQGFAAYRLNQALYGEDCTEPLASHEDDNDEEDFYNLVVVPAADFVADLNIRFGIFGELKFDGETLLKKNFDKWVSTLQTRQVHGTWSAEYLLSDVAPKDKESGFVKRDIIKGVYYPMHQLLYMHVRKYHRRCEAFGLCYITKEQSKKHADLKRRRKAKLLEDS